MRYDSALELQSRVFSRIFHFEEVPMASVGLPGPATFVDPCLMEPAAAAKRLRTRAKRRIVEDIALGITAPDASGTGKAETDSRLAVLVQNRKMLSCHEIDAIKDLARGEAEIVYIGRQRPLWMTARNAPLKMGCSISPSTVNYSGTLGCFCRDSQTGETGILSNNHVLADVNRIAADTPIIQPAAGDGGSAPADVIGRLKRYVPILFGGMPNAVDAAFATTADHDRGEDRQTIFDNASPPQGLATLRPDDKVEAFPGLEVMKTGRTTGHTLGRVRAVNVNNLTVNMGVGIARFDGQIAFEMDNVPPRAFGGPGDSGSLIVDRTGRPVALLFSGSQSGGAGNLGIIHGCPILTVEAQLNVSLL